MGRRLKSRQLPSLIWSVKVKNLKVRPDGKITPMKLSVPEFFGFKDGEEIEIEFKKRR